MASRHVSVRASAHEFHMPAAQFSVSKNQLMPNTGTMAAMMAANGSPICSPRLSAVRAEYRALRIRTEKRRRRASTARTGRRLQRSRRVGGQAPAPCPALEAAGEPAEHETQRDDDGEGDDEREKQVTDDGDERRADAEA